MGPHSPLGQERQASIFDLNARAEDFKTKPSFGDGWNWGQRCLVVTDGFYEWKKLDLKGKEKRPYAIAMGRGRADGHGRLSRPCIWLRPS
jgi:putative SOS response-associated peptidase YedK